MQHESSNLDKLFNSIENVVSKESVFWGCGGMTAAFWLDAVIEAGYRSEYKVDKYKAGKKVRGDLLISPDELFSAISDKNAYVYIVFTIDPQRFIQIKEEIASYGIASENIISCSAAHYYKYKDKIKALYERFEDDDSRRHFEAFLRCRMFGEMINEPELIRGLQYLSVFEFQKIDKNEVYVDAGAYVGDSLEKYLFEKFGTFKRYYAFEPYKDSWQALAYRTERLKKEWGISDDKIIIENKALDIRNGNAFINDSLDPVGAIVEESQVDMKDETMSISTVRLDDYFEEKEYTTLKADIEGKELDMLRGGMKTIKKYGVKLAISVYHCPWDILEIPKLILEINEDYRFKFRCHLPDGADSILYSFL